MGDRCTGHCCRNFYLPHDLEGMTKWAIQQIGTKMEAESAMIVDMIIPISPDPKGGYRYTCKNLDVDTGNCKVYETRPQKLCAEYPNGGACTYKDCTWDAVKLVQLGAKNEK